LELLRFWRFLIKRKWILILTVAFFCLSTLLISFIIKPVYKNKAAIWIDTQSIQPEYISQLPSSLGRLKYVDSGSVIDTFTQIIGSKTAIESVIRRFNLTKDGKRISPEKLFDPGIISLYFTQKKGIKVNQLEDSEVLEIVGYSTDYREATEIANGVLEAFFSTFYNFNAKEAREARNQLEKEIKSVQEEWQRSEAKKKEFMNNNNILVLDTQKTNLLDKISSLESSLINIDIAIKKDKMGSLEIKQKLKSIPEFKVSQVTETLSTFLSNYKNRLFDLQVELAGRLAELKEEHPEIKALRKRIEEVKDNIKNEAERRFASELKARYPYHDTLVQQYIDYEIDTVVQEGLHSATRSKINEYEYKLKRLNGIDSTYQDLTVKSDNLYSLYKTLVGRQRLAVIAEKLNVANAITVDRAILPDSDSLKDYRAFPRRGKLLFISLFLGSLIGFTAMLFIDAIDDNCKTLEELKETGTVPIGAIPFSHKGLKEIEKKDLSSIVSLIMLKTSHGDSSIIPFCSLLEGEGKTILSISTARILSSEGYKVLIVDTDLINRHLSLSFGFSDRAGLTDLITGEVDAKSLICKTNTDGLDVVPSGRRSDVPLTDLARVLQKLIDEIKPIYDVIIFDTPSLSIYPATVDILKAIGSVIVVVKSGKHSKNELIRAVEMLRGAEIEIIGLILNFSRYKF
jgi:capsular exopolysaccharide synthesis family protein